MLGQTDKRTDIIMALVLIAICAVVLFEARDLPPGTFEPLGSAPVPRATAGLIILLSALVIVQAVMRPSGGETGNDLRYLDAGILVLLTIVYVALIHFRLSTFAILTTAYLFLTIGWLVRFRLRSLPLVIATALIVGFGCQYVFTRIFVVDLPGL